MLTYTCSMDLDPTRLPGAWAVHFLANGENAAVLKFELVDGRDERTA